MARKKIKLALIANETQRKATFKKRRKGLMKKVSELSTLCGVKACAIVFNSDGSAPEVWPSQNEALRVLNAYKDMPDMEKSKNMMNQESFLRKSIKKQEGYLSKQMKDNKEKEGTYQMQQMIRDPDAFQSLETTEEIESSFKLTEQHIKNLKERIDEQLEKSIVQDSKGKRKMTESVAEGEKKVALEKAMEDLQKQPWFLDVLNGAGGSSGGQMDVPSNVANNAAWTTPFPFY